MTSALVHIFPIAVCHSDVLPRLMPAKMALSSVTAHPQIIASGTLDSTVQRGFLFASLLNLKPPISAVLALLMVAFELWHMACSKTKPDSYLLFGRSVELPGRIFVLNSFDNQ
jgi:hypothetical protein